jgi:peptidoglycan hydrolase CwlO-like protein
MGAYDFMVNMGQSGQISELQEKVRELEKNMDLAKQWVEYLKKRIDELEKQNGISTK